MKPSLQPGASRTSRIAIDKAKTIGFMGEEGRVYATPYLIGDIEMTCRQLILEHADANEDSVGMEVAIKHLAPTLPGSTVEIAVTVTAVEGRKVSFAVTAKDEIDTISTGSHIRFVVDKAKTIERLKAKAAKLPARTGGESVNILNQLIAVLQDRHMGVGAIPNVAEAIAADARFSLWVLNFAKKHASETQFIELLERYEGITRRCLAVTGSFNEKHDRANLMKGVDDVAQLLMQAMHLPESPP